MPRIHHKELNEHVRRHFAPGVDAETLERYAHEVRTCTFLRNDMHGFYSFVHRSFAEFFAAKFLLDRIVSGNSQALNEDLTLETFSFLSDLIAEHRDDYLHYVWDLLRRPEKFRVDNARLLAVVASVLIRCDEDLSGLDVSGSWFPARMSLAGASLDHANCRRIRAEQVCFDRASLKKADLRAGILVGATFDKTDLTACNFRGADLSGADLSTAILSDATFARARLNDIVLTPEDVRTTAKRVQLSELKEEQVRMRGLEDITELMTATPDKSAKGALRSIARRFKDWSPSDGVDVFRELLSGLLRMLRGVADNVELELKKLNSKTESSQGASENEGLLREQKRRRRRHEVRRLKLKCDALIARYDALLQSSAERQPSKDELTEKLQKQRVAGAVFADSIGLSKEQSDWLRRHGAVVRIPRRRKQ